MTHRGSGHVALPPVAAVGAASPYPAAAAAAEAEAVVLHSGKHGSSPPRTATGTGHPDESVVASIAFLLRMADNFALEGNLPESVKSGETALLLRKANAEAVQRALDRYHRHHHTDNAQGHQTLDNADDEATIPASMDLQGKNLVLQCNSYAVSEFSHKRFDTAAFFLNKALFLTEAGEGSAQMYPSEHADQGAHGERGGQEDKDMNTFLQSVQRNLATGGGARGANSQHDARTMMAVRAAVAAASQHSTGGSFCFSAAAEEDRLRLRAATFNNIGCMERRRGRLDDALGFLRKAIHVESQLDTAGAAASPSTYLNLCTVLNELHLHREAVAAAQSAIAALQQHLLEQVTVADKTRVAAMLMVAQYNLGVSLERRGESRDAAAAQKAYQQSLDTSRRYQLVASDCPTIDAAVAAMKRMKSQLPSSSARAEPQRGVAPHTRDGERADWHLGYSADIQYDLDLLPAPAHEHEQRADGRQQTQEQWAQAAHPELAFSAATHAKQKSDLRLTSTAPAGLLSNIDTVVSQGDPGNASTPVQEATVAAVSATWHPSHATPPRPASASHSNHSDSTRSNPFQATPTPPRPPQPQQQQLQQQRLSLNNNHNHHSLLRPPRAPQQQGGRPQPPPTLAPLLVSITPRDSAASRNGSQLVIPPLLPPSLHGVGDGSRNSATSLGGSGTAVAAALARSPTREGSASVASAHNPFGRRVFGSTTMHQQRMMPSLTPSHSGGASGTNTSTTGPRTGSVALSKQQLSILQEQKDAARGKRMQARQRKAKKRQHDREIAEHDAQLADDVYEQMVTGMEREELARCHEAAIAIQRVWRGVMARTWIRAIIAAATRLQCATRAFLVKVREEHRLAEIERQRRRAEQEARELAACRVLQARVRQFIRRLQIRREYVARQRRSYYAARTIQRGYREYLERKQALLAALAEAHRREDKQRAFRRSVAARRIQRAFHQFQERKAELAAVKEHQRRSRAATTIQSVVRGALTRAWFRYYRAYRHDQAMRSAASQRKITTIQAACRAIASAQYCQQRKRELLLQMQQRRLTLAATRIQGVWRQYVARIHLERLRADKARADRQATILQRWYRTRVARRAFLEHCTAKRRLRAATVVQRWVRALWVQRKEREFARYHAEKLREQQLLRLKQWAIPVMQGCVAARQSALLVASMRQTFEKNERAALLWQRVARGFAARKYMTFEQDIARRVARGERELAGRTVAARVLQRAWRVALAKQEVERRRRERLAALTLARSYRCYRARAELHELRAARRRVQEDHAARTIQAGYRNYCAKRRAQEMRTYYGAEHKKKMWRLRRDEAAVMIQAVWRGHVTRLAMERVLRERQQRTRAAVTIQRAWRGIAQRQTLRAEVALRVAGRQRAATAARVIQCFWRKMAAAERVAAMRDERRVRVQKVAVLQCWWRQVLARRELARRQAVQEEEEALAVLYAAKWERAASLVNAFLRCRQSRLHGVQLLHDSLFNKLRRSDQARFRKRHAAAVAIQRVYKGFYQRCCYRGLLREKRERDRAAAERAAREHRAALHIQCCYRRHRARQELQRRRIAHCEDAILAQENTLASADSHQVVRELFWVRDLMENHDSTAERVARARAHHNAAVTIQKAYRYYRAQCAVAAAARSTHAVRAVGTIETYYSRHRAAVAVKDAQRREAAATLLQARVRGWLVRRRWAAWRADLAEEKRLKKTVEDLLDAAATTIQSAWRRLLARREANARRQRRAMEKETQMREEAASLIQNAFKTHRAGGELASHSGRAGEVYRTY